jgi:hypothetical protein
MPIRSVTSLAKLRWSDQCGVAFGLFQYARGALMKHNTSGSAASMMHVT